MLSTPRSAPTRLGAVISHLRAAALLTTEQDEGRRSDETAATDVVVQLNTNLSTELLCTPATLVTELKGGDVPFAHTGGQMLVEREVQGVVFSIALWNASLLLTIRAVGHAIVCGNAVGDPQLWPLVWYGQVVRSSLLA
ncbi:hypothetical protein DAEQUDRAFT_815851 [Daedalea quercina L-15889]|uniref:Aldehyde dehydrogenase domain-containing protein n=1 Tax=Daedalea quercina L-15889 TaxID=1314783 RepID=A0A165KET4_9APHY|nr:hypothetical protein DAEQUDRAFT_815851 [Daedalea quercina L-15889]